MFTYRDYYDLLTDILSTGDRKLFLRHDVDISLDKAVEMAEREARMSIGPATYFIHTTSNFYNFMSKEESEKIRQIIDLGHYIGLHYDISDYGATMSDVIRGVAWQASFISSMFGIEVNTVTQHEPTRHPASYDLLVSLQKVGLNDPMLTLKQYKYISDSGMMFVDDPNEALKYHNSIHLNIHPEWWAKKEGDFKQRLHDLKLDIDLDKKIYKRVKLIEERNAKFGTSPKEYSEEATRGNYPPV